METWQIITGSIGAFIVGAGFIVGINAKVTTMILNTFYNKENIDKGFVSKEQCSLHHATNSIRSTSLVNTLAEVKEEVKEIRREIGAFMSNVPAILEKIINRK